MNTPSAVIEECGLPSNVAFLGYVIYLPERQAFLAYCQKAHGLIQRAFTKSLDHAKVYHSLEEILEDARDFRERAEPRYLFDHGHKRVVARSEKLACNVPEPARLKPKLENKLLSKLLAYRGNIKPEVTVLGKIAREVRNRIKPQ